MVNYIFVKHKKKTAAYDEERVGAAARTDNKIL